jgi:hypothetical protein
MISQVSKVPLLEIGGDLTNAKGDLVIGGVHKSYAWEAP